MKFYKYTPALLDPKTLEETLIGREVELDNLKRILRNASTRRSISHAILIGPKGIGKTHVLRILYHAVRGEIKTKGIDAYKDKFIPVIFSEEEYPGSVTKFLILTLHYLSESKLEGIPPIPSELMDAVTLGPKEKEIALSYIRNFKKKTGKILLLLVDNLNDIIERFTDEDQSSLREMLIPYDSLLLIGAAPTLFDSIINHDKPFYNFFEIIWLKDLSFEDTVALLKRYARLEDRDDLIQALKEKEGKLRAIHELSGGNPRIILSLYHIIVEGDITSIEDTFLKILDELSPYFRERMKDLSEQQKEIVDVMARSESLLTPTEIAGRCQMPVNLINSQLKRLEKIGYVKVSKKHAKKVFYDFNERLFSFWRQMRVEAGRKKLGFIVKFLEIWFTEEELQTKILSAFKDIMSTFFEGCPQRAEPHLIKLRYILDALPAGKSISPNIDKVIDLISIHGAKLETEMIELREKLSIEVYDQKVFNKFFWLIVLVFSFLYAGATDLARQILANVTKAVPQGTWASFINIIQLVFIINIRHCKTKSITAIKFILSELQLLGKIDLLEFLSFFSTLIKYLDTKDPEIIDRLRHEERIVVDGMLKMLGEKTEETSVKRNRNGKRQRKISQK